VTGRLRSLLELISMFASRDFGARVWFAEVLGRRWSYTAGLKTDHPGMAGMDREMVRPGLGLVCNCWGSLSGGDRDAFLAAVRRLVATEEKREPEDHD